MGNDLIIIIMIISNDNNNNNNVHILVLVLNHLLTYLVTYLPAFRGAVIVGKLRVAKDKRQKTRIWTWHFQFPISNLLRQSPNHPFLSSAVATTVMPHINKLFEQYYTRVTSDIQFMRLDSDPYRDKEIIMSGDRDRDQVRTLICNVVPAQVNVVTMAQRRLSAFSQYHGIFLALLTHDSFHQGQKSITRQSSGEWLGKQ